MLAKDLVRIEDSAKRLKTKLGTDTPQMKYVVMSAGEEGARCVCGSRALCIVGAPIVCRYAKLLA